jgi:hypothetical protein
MEDPLDRGLVTPDRVAMLAEKPISRRHDIDVAGRIPRIRVCCDDAEGLLRSRAADEERQVLADGAGRVEGFVELVMPVSPGFRNVFAPTSRPSSTRRVRTAQAERTLQPSYDD